MYLQPPIKYVFTDDHKTGALETKQAQKHRLEKMHQFLHCSSVLQLLLEKNNSCRDLWTPTHCFYVTFFICTGGK